MAKKIRFPLEMEDGVEVRTIESLRENFNVERVISYFLDGRLQNWLLDRYHEEEAEAIAALSKEDVQLGKKLSEIFGVEYEENIDLEEITRKNERLAKLKQLTDDEEIIKNIDSVAFNQEELADLYDEGIEKIYLGEGDFTIPKSKQNLEYIEFGGARVTNRQPKAKEPEPVQKLELELRRRSKNVFGAAEAIFVGNEKDLFIKDTYEKINDDNENVDKYFVLPDNRIVYCAGVEEGDEDESHYEDCIFVKTVGGDKTLISSANEDDEEYVSLIFADSDKIIWERYEASPSYYSYYFADGKKVRFYEENDCSDNRIVTVYKDNMFVIRDDHLCIIDIKKGDRRLVQIYDNESADETIVYYARYAEDKIYLITSQPKDGAGARAFHCMDMDGNIIQSFDTTDQPKYFIMQDNKVYYTSSSYSTPTIYVLDLNDGIISEIDTGINHEFRKVYIKVKDNYIHFAFKGRRLMGMIWGASGGDSFECYKIKCYGTSKPQKSDITFTDEDRTDYYLFGQEE